MAAIIRVTGVGPAPSRKARVLRSKGFPGIPKSIADGGAHAADRRPTCSQNTFFAFCSRGEACLARFKSLSQFAPTEIESTRIEKGIFTAEEISKLLEKANLDWRGAILVGYFTGARLKDVCNLRWGNVDLEKMLITFRAGKTGQLITVAIHPELSVQWWATTIFQMLTAPIRHSPLSTDWESKKGAALRGLFSRAGHRATKY